MVRLTTILFTLAAAAALVVAHQPLGGSNHAVVAAVAAPPPPTGPSISIFQCSNGTCATCKQSATIPQHKCLSIGNGNYQRVSCLKMPKSRCLVETVFADSQCSTAAFEQPRRCGVCAPGPVGNGVIDCGKAGHESKLIYHYGCDTACRSCNYTFTTNVGSCAAFQPQGSNSSAAFYFRITQVVPCPQIISYRNFLDSNCTQPNGGYSNTEGDMLCHGFQQPNAGVEYQCSN